MRDELSMTRILKIRIGKKDERGFTILEAMVASFIMLIGISGLMALFVVAAAKNAGKGDQATRTTEYAQDKMEQLLALSYNATTSGTVGSTTLPNSGVGLSPGGSVTPGSVVTGYVDYVNPAATSTTDGISTTATGAIYTRQWLIATDTSVVNGTVRNTKTITVAVTSNVSPDVGVNMASLAPSTTLIAMKEQY
jgi:Tfp pilus assembly protein PilV